MLVVTLIYLHKYLGSWLNLHTHITDRATQLSIEVPHGRLPPTDTWKWDSLMGLIKMGLVKLGLVDGTCQNGTRRKLSEKQALVCE